MRVLCKDIVLILTVKFSHSQPIAKARQHKVVIYVRDKASCHVDVYSLPKQHMFTLFWKVLWPGICHWTCSQVLEPQARYQTPWCCWRFWFTWSCLVCFECTSGWNDHRSYNSSEAMYRHLIDCHVCGLVHIDTLVDRLDVEYCTRCG